MRKILILFLLVVCCFSFVAGFSGWVYQENPNESNFSGTNRWLYSNYTKPTGAASNSLWLVKHGNLGAYNATLSDCWDANANKLILRLYSNINDGINYSVSQAQCFNGNDWVVVGESRSALNGYSEERASLCTNGSRAFDGNWASYAAHNLYGDTGAGLFPDCWDTSVVNSLLVYHRLYEEAMWWYVSYTDPPSPEEDETEGYGEREVFFSTEDYICNTSIIDSAFWQRADGDITWVYNLTYDSFGVCNESLYADEWCCPAGFSCEEGRCVAGRLIGVGLRCADVMTRDSCISAPNEFAVGELENFLPSEDYLGICSTEPVYYDMCADYTLCGCIWNETEELCGPSISFISECANGTSSNITCSWVEDRKEDRCSEDAGQITIFYTASGEGELCKDQEQVYPCSVSVQLPFFDKFNFIFSALAIVGIYAFFRRGNYVK